MIIKALLIFTLAIVSRFASAAVTNCVQSGADGQRFSPLAITAPNRVTPGTPAFQPLTDWMYEKTTAGISCDTSQLYEFEYAAITLAQGATTQTVTVEGKVYEAVTAAVVDGVGTKVVGLILEYYDPSTASYKPVDGRALEDGRDNASNVSGSSSYDYNIRYRFISLIQIPPAGGVRFLSTTFARGYFCKQPKSPGLCYGASSGISSGNILTLSPSFGTIAPLTCVFVGSGADGGTLDLPSSSLGANFNASTFSASAPGNWVAAGVKLDEACNASQIEMKFISGPGYNSPSGNASVFGAKANGTADPSVGVELRRKDNALAIKPNDTVAWNSPFATGTDFVEARLVKVGTGTPLVGNGTSAIQATMTYY